ncbi:rho GTPase-activating protein 4-like [Zophobas morio]|uniref:rho GTPase-activating protein 4-like n=1 Tax=Zophobas morio TaxID=2755281 RepID=UPI003082E84D
MLFVRHILQFSLSRLNRLDNQNLDDYQLSFTDSAGNIKVLGIWDCPGCCPAETLLLSAQPPMVATEIHPKKNNLVTRLSKKITKTLRNPLSYLYSLDKSQKSMPSIGSDTAKQLSPTRTDKNFFSVTEKNLQKFPKKTTAYSSLHSLHAAIPSTLEKQDPYELGVFGALIADATHSGSILPAPLLLCFSYVETFGLNLQGIYRISGGHLKMKNIRDSFQRGEVPNFQSITAHNVAGVVKCFYREIPEPFIPPTSKLSELKELEVDSDEMIGALNLLVKELPPGNLLLLRALFRHLHLVHLNSAKNMMPAENLAVVFQPNLGLSTNLVICLIKEYPQIFQDDFKVVPLNFSDFC